MSDRKSRPVLWTSDEIAAAINGRVGSPFEATGVSIDSRTVQPGDLFVALTGPNFDGHDFAADALAKGAVAAVVTRQPKGVSGTDALVIVDDTMAALEDLARVARHRFTGTMIAVTGSVGKTSTKEALARCLAVQAETHSSVGNLNNHWGVPLSLARLPRDARYSVIELGMNKPGEIDALSRITRPDIAIITAIELAHSAYFDSEEGIADAKSEIFNGMEPSGIAILPSDNRHYARLLAAARTQGLARIVSFGVTPKAEARLVDSTLHASSSAVMADILGTRHSYTIAAPGRHWVTTSLSVLLAVTLAGADSAYAARALSEMQPLPGRGERLRIRYGDGTLTVIDETYNASPAAMKAALQVLAGFDPPPGGRRIAVLGDMLELGKSSRAAHETLLTHVRDAGVHTVFTTGEMMAHLHDLLPATMRGTHAADSAALATLLAETVKPGDVVLVKGSAGVRMGQIVAALKDLEGQSAGGRQNRSGGGPAAGNGGKRHAL